jgi:hypothetical protein
MNTGSAALSRSLEKGVRSQSLGTAEAILCCQRFLLLLNALLGAVTGPEANTPINV